MVENEREFCVEVTKKKAINIINKTRDSQVYFVKILDLDYVVTNIEKKYNDYTSNEARYFLNLKRYTICKEIK